MKTILLLLAVALLMSACASSDYGYGYSSYGSRPYYSGYQQREMVFQGPQYYRVQGVPYGTNIRNYTDAPIVVTRPGCSREIIPRSWD